MNDATSTVEQAKRVIGGLVWGGSEIVECEVFGKCGHSGIEEEAVEIAIGEMLDAEEIVSTLVKVSSGWVPGLRRAKPLAAEQKQAELDEANAERARSDRERAASRRCETHETELMVSRATRA
jgi:hypothetical protein